MKLRNCGPISWDSGRIDRISHGQLPKELDGQLKRIEKLAKHLRAEVAQ